MRHVQQSDGTRLPLLANNYNKTHYDSSDEHIHGARYEVLKTV